MRFSRAGRCFSTIEVLSYVSLAPPTDNSTPARAGRDYREEFLDLGGLRIMMLILQAVPKCSGQEGKTTYIPLDLSYAVFFYAMATMFKWLFSTWGTALAQRREGDYWLTPRDEVLTARIMLELLGRVHLQDVQNVLDMAIDYLILIHTYDGEAVLRVCLATSAQADLVYPNLLVAITDVVNQVNDPKLLREFTDELAKWCARYPSVAAFVQGNRSYKLVTAEYAARRRAAGTANPATSDNAAAVPVASAPVAHLTSLHNFTDGARVLAGTDADSADTGSGRVTADRRCAYPGCTVTGTDGTQSTLKCARCRAVYYCSKEHQTAHWKEHKAVCRKV
jgi:hypothetical protein